MMSKEKVFAAIAVLNGLLFQVQTAQAQQQLDRAEPVAVARQKAQPVINLGDVVINVVIAKVQNVGVEPELLIAKFGGKEADAAPFKNVTVLKTETRTRTVLNAEGKQVEQSYTVQIPVVTQVANRKENVTLSEENRSVPFRTVQAFTSAGNPVDKEVLMKRLQNPTHVLLVKEPINESNKLNPFYASILRDDILLLFLPSPNGPQETRPAARPMFIAVYHVDDLDEWPKAAEEKDSNDFVTWVKSKVTPTQWDKGASLRVGQDKKTLVVAGNDETHQAMRGFFELLRKDKAKAREEK
jgi:hypothetical protein